MNRQNLIVMIDRLRIEQSDYVNKKFGLGGIKLLTILRSQGEISKEDYEKMYKPVLFFDVKYSIRNN